jgi:hypothetical protein
MLTAADLGGPCLRRYWNGMSSCRTKRRRRPEAKWDWPGRPAGPGRRSLYQIAESFRFVRYGTAAFAAAKTVAELDMRESENVTINLRGEVNRGLAARFTALLPGRSSPFVTQSELVDLVKRDRSEIERQICQAEWMMRHPQRGMPAAPYLLIDGWKRFLCWIDCAIQHLEQPRPVPELEHLIRTWQDRRGDIVAPNLRWRRRADVIAV